MELRDVIISTKTFISEKNLRNGSHSWFFHEINDNLRGFGDIHFFEGSTKRGEEMFCFDTVWTIVLGIDSDHKKIEIVINDNK
jgi:hypothetical protein